MNLEFFNNPKTGFNATIKRRQINIFGTLDKNDILSATAEYFKTDNNSYKKLPYFKNLMNTYENENELNYYFYRVSSDIRYLNVETMAVTTNRPNFFNDIFANQYKKFCRRLKIHKQLSEFAYRKKIKKIKIDLSYQPKSYYLPANLIELDRLSEKLTRSTIEDLNYLKLINKKKAGILRIINKLPLKKIGMIVPLSMN